MFKQALLDLEDKVLELGGENLEKYGLPKVDRSVGKGLEPREVLRERAYNFEDLQDFTEENEPKLRENEDQKHAYDTLLLAVEGNKGGLFFLDAPGGTGKTFLTNLLMAK
ncbi:ATP-dependent DNA helicase, partial [Caligus rogercresseyi]